MAVMDNIQDLKENFALFDDWEERYRYLIDLGRVLPKMDDALKTDETLVRGCTSKVWLAAHVKDGVLHFQADSDAHIVRGLVALLVAAYDGQKLSDIPNIDIEGMFSEIGLDQHLSPNRRNGFFAMVERIRSFGA
ncbi:MAG: Fe-S cluster assembly protein SufE [Micavibrio sp.]|nr:Fe-S cluster assembly protein SufE [Micavibrio sp.]|tara:strand:+ start:3132 stop:3536 length:405 start_codon:yes stop_codon:yes gene_type:complete